MKKPAQRLPIITRMINAGMAASAHLIMNRIIDPKGMLISTTLTRAIGGGGSDAIGFQQPIIYVQQFSCGVGIPVRELVEAVAEVDLRLLRFERPR